MGGLRSRIGAEAEQEANANASTENVKHVKRGNDKVNKLQAEFGEKKFIKP